MRVIVDTNVFVSGLLNRNGAPAKIIDAILEGELIAVMSKATFSELSEVLLRQKLQPYFLRAQVDPNKFLIFLETILDFVEIKSLKNQSYIRDIKDQPFLELTTILPPPDYLITGDKDFEQSSYSGVQVISVSQFVSQFL